MEEKKFETIVLSLEDNVGRIRLNRPEVHNAFNAVMIRELREALRTVGADEAVRVVVLSGQGKSFCAGADLNWMREIITYSYEQNLRESLELADFLYELYALPKPTIARVNGAAIGGGAGFLSACDIVVASTDVQLGLSEVKIGLVPACIAPYVLRRTGESRARRLFLTGERFEARRAAEIGLVDEVAVPEDLDGRVDGLIGRLLSSGAKRWPAARSFSGRYPG